MSEDRKITLEEATSNIIEMLHCCDVEAQEFSNWVALNGTPDGVVVLEFVEKIVLAASKYASSYDKYIFDKVSEALSDTRPLVPQADVIRRIRDIIGTGCDGDA